MTYPFFKTVYGDEAKNLAKAIDGNEREPGEYDINTKVYLTVKYVEGHCVVDVGFEV